MKNLPITFLDIISMKFLRTHRRYFLRDKSEDIQESTYVLSFCRICIDVAKFETNANQYS